MKPPASVTLLLALSACSAPRDAAPTVPRWRLSDQPVLDIGTAQGEEPYELEGAASSLRLADGRVLVANTGSSEIRVYDSAGHYLSTIGRQGEGPGEFTGAIQLALTSNGEFLAYDRGQERLSLFDSSGTYREARRIAGGDSVSAFPLWVWLQRANWIVGPTDSSGRAGVVGVLSAMGDPPRGAYRYVQVASDGRIWSQVRFAGDSAESWQVHAADGALLAIATLPARFEVHQVGSDFILGRHWDDDEVEHIRLYRVVPGTAAVWPVPAGAAVSHDLSDVAALRTQLITALRNLVMAQEMFYADSNRYATVTGTLKWEVGQGILHLMEADRRGWVGVLAHPGGAVICGMAVGSSTPPGWGEGSPKCGGR
jgi:hypothetical protein